MFSFVFPQILWLLFLVPILFIFTRKKSKFENYFSKEVLEQIYIKKRGFSARCRANLLIFSISMLIIALSRPVLKNNEIEVKSSFIDIVVGLDISKSMSVKDIFPNRFEFSKQQLFAFLDSAQDKKISIVGFSSRAFLVSPLTNDFESLKFLVKNMNFSYLNLKGTSVLSFLESANLLFENGKERVVLIFSDGGDKENFSQEIAYAKKNNITVYVYLTATQKGGFLKDDSGDMVVLRANEGIKSLALQTGGTFMNYSPTSSNMKSLNETISSKFNRKKEEIVTINDQRELFYYALVLAILFYFMAIFSLPERKFR